MLKITPKKLKVAIGIVTKKILTGPIEVSVDLTRKCTTDCIMCWYWSPLLKQRPSQEWLSQHIEYELFQKLIKDFKKLKVKRIIFGGQGDPFLYPDIMKVIETTKENGIEACLITSGYYFNEERIKRLVELKVDHIDVSMQAAISETYKKIHPTLKEGTFERIKGSLLLLSELKKKLNQKNPTVTLINAICNLNYQDTVKMVEFAHEMGAGGVGYKRVDIIPETKEILLNDEQLDELKSLLKKAKEKAINLGIKTSLDFYDKYISEGLTTGNYTSRYYTQIPCYVGWLSSRILSDGSVIPCCGCYAPPLGNIRNNSFYEIWYSKEYQKFRQESINIQKNSGLVENCKCYSCIDFEFNLGVYKKLHPLGSEKQLP
ncbi:MAG: radical SAM protein [Elusimicrobia bacterium]|nr:radical SAM protein [Elusimicrobiota bacterium]